MSGVRPLTNADAFGTATGAGNPLCAAFDDAVANARTRLWLAVPWVYTRQNQSWLRGFIDRVAAAARRGVEVRAYLRPDPTNSHAVAVWQRAGVRVVQDTPRVRYLHSKVLITDTVAIISTANLTETDLFRNVNHLTVEHEPEVVRELATSLELLEEPESTPPEAAEAWADSTAVLPADIRRYLPVKRLNPMQAAAIPRVMHAQRNLVIAAPTGSGKTLVAEVALVQAALRQRTGVYLAPMRAIASEKRDDWRRLERAGLRVYKTTGEDDAFDPAQAQQADLIVATPEKWDAISRRRLPEPLVRRIAVIVIDEVHLVDDETRGPGLEALLARIHLAFPAARLVAMSGTLHNAEAIARWLQADLYESQWRPVALTTVVVPYPQQGHWQEDEALRTRLTAQIVQDTLAEDGATVVFCGSRKGVESCAAQLGTSLGLRGSVPAGVQHGALRQALSRGVAFHHAGLTKTDRATVEHLFRSGEIKVLVATSTVAAGVNLPARVVVVRDLLLGTTEIGATELLQMAGRAGRAGQETVGRCFVLTPDRDTHRIESLLGGRPIGSRLGEDLETHLNTEIALGIIRSRNDVETWHARTLHAQVAGMVDLDGALQTLLDAGFVVERDEGLMPTDLGRTTSALMLRVDTAAALERFLAERTARTSDPAALDQDLLVAACALPVEFTRVLARKGDEDLYRHLVEHDPQFEDWEHGRLLYLVVASSVLSGAGTDQFPTEGAEAVVSAVQRELPRVLRFLAHRADRRLPGAPDVMAAAADLATALEFGVAQRGAGALLETLKRAYRPDETRRRKVVSDYARLQRDGVRSLADAMPFLPPLSQRFAATRPLPNVSLTVQDGVLVGRLADSPGPVGVHVRVATPQREQLLSLDGADPREVAFGRIDQLGAPGSQTVTLDVVLTGGTGMRYWAYGTGQTTVDLPAPTVDFAKVEALLQAPETEYDSIIPANWGDLLMAFLRGEFGLLPFQQQLEHPPARVRQAAMLLGTPLTTVPQKAEIVAQLLRRRSLIKGNSPRALNSIAGAPALTRTEAAVLACALLRSMGVESRLLWATLDGEEAALCVCPYQNNFRALTIWPLKQVNVVGHTVLPWADEAETKRGQTTRIGWEVLRSYEIIHTRVLPFALPPEPKTRRHAGNESAGPACPACGSSMRKRTGPYGAFWGCQRYPACSGKQSIDEPRR